MSTADFNRALAHPDLQGPAHAAVCAEVHYGLPGDARVLLCAAVEGLICAGLPDYRRATYLDPLPAARLLAKDAVLGRRLWSAADQAKGLALIAAAPDVRAVLALWVRARGKYRELELAEARKKIRYADGRPADLAALSRP